MVRRTFLTALFLAIPGIIFAVDGIEALKYLEDKALSLLITTRVVDDEGNKLWETEMTRITISGKSVKVKLSGVNVLVVTDITPYIMKDNTILLVSQGEIWIGSSDSDEMKHYSTIKSIPVSSGESVIFFPLGVIKATETRIYNIELEIQVKLHKDIPAE